MKYFGSFLVCSGYVVLISCGGCSPAAITGSSAHVTLEVLAPGEACAAGGGVVTSGRDADGDGHLVGDEVADRVIVCAGADGASGINGAPGGSAQQPLVVTTEVPPGAECPGGGVRVSAGFDDGAGGGTANDGVLSSGEIRSSGVACGVEPASPPPEDAYIGSFAAPSGPTGTGIIDLEGGPNVVGNGGNGGELEATFVHGSLGGHVRMFATGTAPVDRSVVSAPTPSFGSQHTLVVGDADVPSNVYVTAVADPNTAPADGYYVIENAKSSPIYYKPLAPGALEVVSGIDVVNGSLILQGIGATEVFVSGDVRSAGRITLAGNTVSVRLRCDRYVGLPTSIIRTRQASLGADAADVFLTTMTGFHNEGMIDAAGAVGDLPGGGAGGIVALGMAVPGPFVHTGEIDVSGGAGYGPGGAGGAVLIQTQGLTRVLGAVNARGGDGGVGDGGAGGAVAVFAQRGAVHLGGTITVSGGASSGPDGGKGGTVDVTVRGAAIVSDAEINLDGGAGGATGLGANGGSLLLETTEAQVGLHGAGSIEISNNLSAKGGASSASGDGGLGGSVKVRLDAGVTPTGQQITFYGFFKVTARGGTGAGLGGVGGNVKLRNAASFDGAGYAAAGGGVVNDVLINLSGGGGALFSSFAGFGGRVEMSTQTTTAAKNGAQRVLNRQEISLSGGGSEDGAWVSSSGGSLSFYGYEGVVNTGSIWASAGNAGIGPGAKAEAAPGSPIALVAPAGDVENLSDIWASGGEAASGAGGDGRRGGAGGCGVRLEGESVRNLGQIGVAGGWGAGGAGGAGGSICLVAHEGSVMQSGMLDVSGGMGSPMGAGGVIAQSAP